MTSIDELCADDANKAVVEESDGFIFYQLAFMVAYGVLFILCAYGLVADWREKRKIVCNNNRYQVLLCLALGCFIRIFSFIEVNCVYEEVFRCLKDTFFVMAFVLIVLFWIELQTGMRSMKSIQRLRPYLITVMVVYAIFRVFASIADLFWSGTLKNLFNGVCILIYGSIMALGLYYGISLLSKMKSMQRSDIQARLQKLTRFIILENVVLIFFLFAYLVRVGVFGKKKETDPWMWFYLKLIEKVLEIGAIFILCLTMTGSKKGKAKEKKPAGARYRTASSTQRRSARAKKAGRAPAKGAAAANGTTTKAVLLTESPRSTADEWVPVKSSAGKIYFFNILSRKAAWKMPTGATKVTLSEYKRRMARKREAEAGGDEETGAINPLNVEVEVPPPPSLD